MLASRPHTTGISPLKLGEHEGEWIDAWHLAGISRLRDPTTNRMRGAFYKELCEGLNVQINEDWYCLFLFDKPHKRFFIERI